MWDGFLLFSDPNSNRIYKYTSDGSLSVFRENSGYAGADIAEYAQPGSNGQVFFDLTSAPGEDAIDGLKVDQLGNVYVSGPGGIWILSRAGKHLGTIIAPMHPHNFAWGDEDGKSLYLCARSGLYRMRLNIPGIRP